jgi:histidine triad (HIT) family protein
MDVMPQSQGHTLVIPKTNARNLFDIEPQSLAQLIKATQHIAKAVRAAFNPDGMRIIQFNEPAAGQTVFHIHFHIIPCYEGRELKGHSRDMADKTTLAGHAERVRQALASAKP